jgi:hypothetical protein
MPVGISFGTVKNIGWYVSLRGGGYSDLWETTLRGTTAAGVTKYLWASGKYRLHGYAGLGYSLETWEEYTYYTTWSYSYFTVDAGIVNVFNRLNLTLGLAYFAGGGADLVFGVGFVF